MKYGREPKLTLHQRQEALASKAAGETVRVIAGNYALDASVIPRLTGPAMNAGLS